MTLFNLAIRQYVTLFNRTGQNRTIGRDVIMPLPSDSTHPSSWEVELWIH